MTRVNVVDPGVLTDQHLLAEYREIPRVITASNQHKATHATHIPAGQPNHYVLGAGHMKFFYNKQMYIWQRHQELVDEMIRRGFKTNIELEKPMGTFVDWEPDSAAWLLNAQRLVVRIEEAKSNPMYYRKEIDRADAVAMILNDFSKVHDMVDRP